MNIEEFNFELPEELIAQKPLTDRTSSNLLVLNRDTKEMKHEKFSDIINYLTDGDCLVLNDTRVLPARLFGVKEDTGAKIELLLLNEEKNDCWETLVKPAKKVQIGTVINIGEGKLLATCIGVKDHGGRVFKLDYNGIFNELLADLGEMPLPPYIHEQLLEKDRYQTVYATKDGSAAAPTAGLHFTNHLLKQIQEKGVNIVYITLHVGLGTFRPVSVTNVNDHTMHAEFYQMSEEAAATLSKAKENNGQIVAVGTTTTRTLETIVQDNEGKFVQSSGWTDIFIYPPYQFRAIDGLVTNFHLPKSTLIMLVSAFADKESIMHAYDEAILNRYRFFSFGDAMLIFSQRDV